MPITTNEPSMKEAMRLTNAKLNRLSWSLNAYGKMLAAAVRQDTSPEAREVEKLPDEQVPEHVARLIQDKADPTVAKTMTGWLVKQYAQGALRLEDLGTAYETLDMFHRYAQSLPKGEQDLGQYPSLAKVWEVVSPIALAEQENLSGKAQKALDRDKAYVESRILRQDPDGFTIAVPLTEFAAKWWGKGTRWCTAAEKDNRFWQYHKDAPLIVVNIPELKEKGKFQIWATKGDVQFMDAADKPVSEVLITEYWPRFEPVLSLALQQNGWALNYVPLKLRTEALCKIAITRHGEALRRVPEKLRTEELCKIAVAQHGRALGYVPQNLRTEEMCRIAVAQNGRVLDGLPEDLRTEDLCRTAVAQNGWALEYVPEGLRTEEICSIAVARNGQALAHVPESLRTAELCGIAVAQDGWALGSVPEKLRTEELRRIAVAQAGWALQYVPQKLCTKEMYKIAVAQDGEALLYVPWDLLTEDLCKIAVAQNGWALRYVPEKLRTEALCRIAVAQDGGALRHVPEALRDRINCPTPSPMPAWDISLLDELVNLLDATSSPAPLGVRYA
jgi:Domain of unknown function (DUF4116)